MTDTDTLSPCPHLEPCPWCRRALYTVWRRANPRASCKTEGCFGRKMAVVNLDDPGDVAAWNCRSPSPASQPVVAPAQPVGWAIFAENGNCRMWTRDKSHAEAAAKDIGLQATPLYAAPQSAVPAQAGEYPPLVCDYCGALTPDPWHSSGMLHGKMSKHIHSCDSCAARGATQAAPVDAENEIDLLAEAALCERLDTCLAAARAAQKEAND